jgi:alpha-tubulin suppressor-like RCC1 family protein
MMVFSRLLLVCRRRITTAVAFVAGVSCGGRSAPIEPFDTGGALDVCTGEACTGAPSGACDGGACASRRAAVAVSAVGPTCALTAAGGVKCWGHNYYGVLGDGSTVDSNVPVDVAGLSSGAIAVSTGGDHVCALTSAGAVKCWGENAHGQLGDGSTVSRDVPVDVVGLSSGVIAISATCAVTAAGAVKCWGRNNFGQLGDGSTMNRDVPVDVVGLSSGVVAVSSGGNDACALTAAGAVKCWGWSARSHTPVDVVGLSSSVNAISVGGGFTCAVTSARAVKCWGMNDRGQLGNGSTESGDVFVGPVDVVGLSSGVVAVSTGGDDACALTAAGAVKCWGENAWGQLGDGSTVDSHVPVDVVGLSSGVIAVSAGTGYTCAITTVGAVKCWGLNANGGLGDGTTTERHVPVTVVGF